MMTLPCVQCLRRWPTSTGIGGPLHRNTHSEKARKRLKAQYESLNVAALHRRIEELRNRLFAATQAKNSPEPAGARRRGRGIQVVGVVQQLRQRKKVADRQ
jgi:hypothetical protein